MTVVIDQKQPIHDDVQVLEADLAECTLSSDRKPTILMSTRHFRLPTRLTADRFYIHLVCSSVLFWTAVPLRSGQDC